MTGLLHSSPTRWFGLAAKALLSSVRAMRWSVSGCVRLVAALGIVTSLSGCGGDDGSSYYALNVYVAGLKGSGLQVTLNGGAPISISTNSQTTVAHLANGAAYTILVNAQPTTPAQRCSATNPSGKISDNNVDVMISCVIAGTPNALIQAPESVLSYASVLLDGTLSSDATSSINSYAWTQIGGPSVAVNGAKTAQSSFTAPQVTSPTAITFQLVITDVTGVASQSLATVQVIPATSAQLAPTFVNLSVFQTFSGNVHNNLLPFDGPPLVGSTLTAIASLSGAVVAPAFTVVDGSGKVLSTLTMSVAGSPSLQPIDFIGTIAIPSVPFRIVATGTTSDGQHYSLLSPALITPMNMAVAFLPPSLLLKAGTSSAASLQIQNAGTAAQFTVSFHDPNSLLSQSQSVSVQLAAGQTSSIPLTIAFPGSPNGLFHSIISATASVSGDATRTGSTTLEVWLNGAP